MELPTHKSTQNEWLRLRTNLLYSANWLANALKDHLRPYELTLKQYNVLRILETHYPDSLPIQIVRSQMIDKMSDVSRILDRLVGKDLVGKQCCEDDRRSNRVKLTEAGLQKLQAVDQTLAELDAITQSISLEQAEQLNQLLESLCQQCSGPTSPHS
ncbi:MAG: MarR family transcriptional regulator [Bacteroidota bacterium]